MHRYRCIFYFNCANGHDMVGHEDYMRYCNMTSCCFALVGGGGGTPNAPFLKEFTFHSKISNKHFAYSIVKSIFRFVASGLLAYAGYILWSVNNYTDIFIADAGFLMMASGAVLFIAEVLGIIEEL